MTTLSVNPLDPITRPGSTPAPAITLEPRTTAHAEELFAVLCEPRLYEFLDDAPPASVEVVRAMLARTESGKSPDGTERWLNWVVRDEAGRMVGYVQATVRADLETNVAYCIGSAHWGRGIAFQAVDQMLRLVSRDFGVSLFYVVAERANERSIRLAQRLGFVVAPPEQCVRRRLTPTEILLERLQPAVNLPGQPTLSATSRPHKPHDDATRLLDNISWHTLNGPHRKYSAGTEHARRYAPGFSPIGGFSDLAEPDFAALARYCEPGEHLYCAGWSGAAPEGWRIEAETTMFLMLWDAALPPADEAPEALPLGPAHAAQALELATLTRPGPFGPRTIELGEYFGLFDGGRLIAMAGERMQAGRFHEISGVCTHPDFQGRGLARRLMLKLIRRQMLRDETPFLHVMRENTGARGLYARMGFRDHLEYAIRVVHFG